jgi:hypothetical protein
VIRHPDRLLTIALFAAFLAACSSPLSSTEPSTLPVTGSTPEHWTPSLQASWQIQYSGAIDPSLPVDIYNLDLFDTSLKTIADLHARGVRVICTFSAGTYAGSRPDADKFPAVVIGSTLPDHPDEQWLDIRNLQTLAPIMLERIALASQKGCDGVDPDHVDGYAHDSGFPLAPEDQLAYNVFLANAAHQNRLGVGLKNDLEQVPILLPYFDWAISEECFFYQECHLLQPFVNAGKPVFVIEYNLTPEEFCFQSIDLNFNAMQKKIELDAFRFPCR